MGHESRIEPWLPMTTVLLVSFRTDWLRREDTMKTAWKETGNRWAAVFSIRMDGAAGQNRTCSSTWGWKQEKFQRWGKCFLLNSPSIELSFALFSKRLVLTCFLCVKRNGRGLPNQRSRSTRSSFSTAS